MKRYAAGCGTEKTRLLIALGLFVAVALIYTLPYKNWGFCEDDYAGMHTGLVTSPSHLLEFFTDNPTNKLQYPSNYKDDVELTFFGVMYRPLMPILLALEVYLLPYMLPYSFFLVSMLLFAFNVALLFYILSLWFSVGYALVGTLLFAFHPSLGWLGWITVQEYFVSFLSIGFSLLLLRSFIAFGKQWHLFLSTILFLISVFIHEASLGYLGWLGLVLPFYLSRVRKCKLLSGAVFTEAVTLFIPFAGVVLVYLGMRLMAFPMVTGGEGLFFDPTLILSRLRLRLLDFVTFLVDSLSLTWIPPGNRLRKGIAVLSVLSGFSWVFLRSKKKLLIGLLGVGFLSLSWLSIVMSHQMRYLYLGLPFLIAAALTAVQSVPLNTLGRKRFECCMALIAAVFIGCGWWHNHRLHKAYEQKSHMRHIIQQNFAAHLDPQDKPICFVGMPQSWFACEGMAQSVWLYRGNSDVPVYHDWLMNVRCHDCPTLLEEAYLPRGDLLDVSVKGRLVHLKSKDHNNVWIRYKTGYGEQIPCTMGTFTPIEKEGDKVFEATIEIDDRWYSKDLQFVTWDFERQQFVQVKKL